MGKFIGCFFAFLEVQTSMVAEFYGIIHATGEAQNVWLECDSFFVCASFTARTNAPWMLHNR